MVTESTVRPAGLAAANTSCPVCGFNGSGMRYISYASLDISNLPPSPSISNYFSIPLRVRDSGVLLHFISRPRSHHEYRVLLRLFGLRLNRVPCHECGEFVRIVYPSAVVSLSFVGLAVVFSCDVLRECCSGNAKGKNDTDNSIRVRFQSRRPWYFSSRFSQFLARAHSHVHTSCEFNRRLQVVP